MSVFTLHLEHLTKESWSKWLADYTCTYNITRY